MRYQFRTGDRCVFNYPDFGTPDGHPDYTAHRGAVVTVVSRMSPKDRDIECGPGYIVRADDQWTGEADEAELEKAE